MNFKFFREKKLIGWILIILMILAFLSILSIFLTNVFSRITYSAGARKYFSEDFILKSSNYHKISLNIAVARYILSWMLMAAIILFLFKYLKTPRIGIFNAFLYILLFYMFMQLILLPLDYYRGYIIEHRFGLSNQTNAMWFADYLKSSGISTAISVLGLTGLYALMSYLPGYWWIISSAALALFIIAATYLYPILIDPLFYNFKKLENREFTSEIIEISGKAGMEIDEVLVADASRITNKANAYFTGIGNSRRIVVYDNLINNFEKREALSVIAHEIGHWHYRHIFKNILIGIASGTLALYLLNIILNRSKIAGDFKSILIIIFILSVLSFLMLPAENALSRIFEKQADNFTLETTNDPRTQISLMVRLSESNLSNISPPPLIKYFLYSHPPILERIKNAEDFN